jgi:hypothetical protein
MTTALHHALLKPVHPRELVLKLLGADGIAIGQVDVDDFQVARRNFQVARLRVGVVARQGSFVDGEGLARDNRDPVVGFLADRCAVITELLERLPREVEAFKFLQHEYIRPLRFEPVKDLGQPRLQRIYVPACD